MKRRTLVGFCAWGFGLVVCGAAQPCRAGSIQASADNPDPAPFNSSGGYMNVAAYSDQMGASNTTVTSTVVFGGVPQVAPANYKTGVGLTTTSIFVPNGKMKLNFAGTRMVPDGTYLKPVAQNTSTNGLAFTKNFLSAVGDQDTIESATGLYSGEASVSNTSVPGQGKYTLSASAIAGILPGHAAALAGDPEDIPSGTYTYDPNITADINLTSGEAGDARIYAVDGYTDTTDSVDNFIADDEPLNEALWSLVIGGNTPSTNSSNVTVDFELNPTALNEITFPSSYLAALGSYSNQSSEASLVDQSMDTTLAADMSDVAGQDDLTDVDPFPSGTTFTPETNEEEYSDGVDVGIEAPEPAAIWMISAFAGLCLRRHPPRF